MSEQLVRETVAGIDCEWRLGEPTVVTFVPTHVVPERDARGRPVVFLVATGSKPVLQLGVRWEAPSGQLAAVRSELARRLGDVDPSLFHMQPILMEGIWVELFTLDDAGEATPLASTTTSGYPPYNTIIRCEVPPDRVAAVKAALGGERGHLTIRYYAGPPPVPTLIAVPPTVLADADVGAWLRGADAPLVIVGPDEPVTLGDGGPTSDGGDHQDGVARLGFDPGTAPLAYVELGTAARLSGPDFVATRPEAGPLEVRTHFTTHGGPYSTVVEVPMTGDLVLSESELGMATITIDGQTRREAGAVDVRVHAVVRPGPSGEPDERTFTLASGCWEHAWQVVTRAREFDGLVVVDTMERHEDGSASWTPAAEHKDRCVVL